MSNKIKGARKPVKESLAFLIENELQKAEVVLAAKSITEKIGKMAADLVGLEGDDIMPMLDTLNAAFGPQVGEQFKSISIENLRKAAEALTAAKTTIDGELAKLEGILNGEPVSPTAAAPAPVAPPQNDMAKGLGADDAGNGDDAPDAEAALGADEAPIGGVFPDDEDDSGSFSGRARKESFTKRGSMIAESELRNAANPDSVVLRAFRSMISEGVSAIPAAKSVAKHYGIDMEDVVAIVREAFDRKKKVVNEVSTIAKPNRNIEVGGKYDASIEVVDGHDGEYYHVMMDGHSYHRRYPTEAAARTFIKREAARLDQGQIHEDATNGAGTNGAGTNGTGTNTPSPSSPTNPADVQKAKTIADRLKTSTPGGKVSVGDVGGGVQKNIASVGKTPNDASTLSPLVTQQLNDMGALKEQNDKSPISGAKITPRRSDKNALMSKNAALKEENTVSVISGTPVNRKKGNTMMSKPASADASAPAAPEVKEMDEDTTKNFNPGGKKGKLHRELGVPEDKKIPSGKLRAATHSKNPEIARDAKRAETMKKWDKR